MPKPAEAIKIKPRKCKYCKLIFAPACRNEQQRKNAEAQQFCSANHRKAFHRNGGINFEALTDKVRHAITKDPQFREWLTAELNRASNQLLQDRLREVQHETSRAPLTHATV